MQNELENENNSNYFLLLELYNQGNKLHQKHINEFFNLL